MALCLECGRADRHHPNCPNNGERLGYDEDYEVDSIISEAFVDDERDGDGRGYLDRY